MYLAFKYAKKKLRSHGQLKQSLPSSSTTPPSFSPDPDPNPERHHHHQSPTQSIHRDNTTLLPPATTTRKDDHRTESKKRKRSNRIRLLLCLFLPSTLYALDTTIIASALPSIASSFSSFSQLNLIITCFTLTSCTFLPFFSQISDIFGRYYTLQSSLLITILGSAICTGCPTSLFWLLLLGRAVQGIGIAGLNISVRIILADGVSMGEYVKRLSFFAVIQGIGFGVGPILGGYLSSGGDWRWCFGINLPVGVAGIVGVGVGLRRKLKNGDGGKGRWGRVDWGGQVLFLMGMGLLVLGFTWAGGTYRWDEIKVLVLLGLGGVVTGGWLIYEWGMVPGRVMERFWAKQEAMMPWELLATRNVGLLFFVNCSVGAAMFAVMYYMDLYFTLVMGHDAGEAGLALLYFLPGLGVGVYMTSLWINVWPRQTFPVLALGTTMTAVGISVLSWACHEQNQNLIYGMMALTGFGVGTSMNPGSLHGLAYFPDMTAAITCVVSFATPFGGTVALTIMSTVFNNKSGINHEDPKIGIAWGFIALLPIMWTAVFVTTLLGNVWVSKESGHEVVHRSWFWSVVMRKKLETVKLAQEIDGGDLGVDRIVALRNVKVPSTGPGSEVGREHDIERGRD
ncbi:major facilitator superfamily domain-containing protein [Podospora fimiseda]|uniref:Major facilitator superfamily domain-containing protein n=1 Tax=Podospora fimiseda TaxID=252190 RepID=A0AAN7GNE1_9PEZI|nr:major facilitator superfamily domain-containing protein [Podospora fimiseda]